jgi:Predicted Fe-S oxidoreductases
MTSDLKKIGSNKIPKTLFWAIISYCNAVCTTCDFRLVPRSSWRCVRFEDARKAIDILYDSDFRMVSITGGEPLMNPDVFAICDYLKRKNMIITYIPTNGTLVNNNVARRLKNADVRLVGISIDMDDGRQMGLTRKIPNLRQVIINARECLEQEGVKTYAGILITRSTLDIAKVMGVARELGFSKVVFSYPQIIQSSSFMASGEMEDLVLNVNEIERVVEQIKMIKNDSELSIHNPNVSLDELVRFYRGESRKFKCYGGKRLFYLDWNLNLYRCFTLPKMYGNLLQLKKVNFDEELCDLCSQQAFRDHDPFYHLASTLAESRKLFIRGHLVSATKLLVDNRTRGAIKAFSEFLRGDFL